MNDKIKTSVILFYISAILFLAWGWHVNGFWAVVVILGCAFFIGALFLWISKENGQ